MSKHEPPLYLDAGVLMFEDTELVDIATVPRFPPSAQGRLVQLLDELNRRWNEPHYTRRYYDSDEEGYD